MSHDYNPYTVLSLVCTFFQKAFVDFVEYLEQMMMHPIRLIFWYGQKYCCDLDDRAGWKMEKREMVGRFHGLRIGHSYSIWFFDPGDRPADNAEAYRKE